MGDIVVITPPAVEAVSLDMAKSHLRVAIDGEDDDLNRMIVAARQHAEIYCQLAFVTQTLELRLRSFPRGAIQLRGPLKSLASIIYRDSAGADQTLASAAYEVNAAARPATVEPVFGGAWPDVTPGPAAIRLRFDAGFSDDAAGVPAPIVQAMLLMIGTMYEHRETVNVGNITSEMPLSAKWLLDAYRVSGF